MRPIFLAVILDHRLLLVDRGGLRFLSVATLDRLLGCDVGAGGGATAAWPSAEAKPAVPPESPTLTGRWAGGELLLSARRHLDLDVEDQPANSSQIEFIRASNIPKPSFL